MPGLSASEYLDFGMEKCLLNVIFGYKNDLFAIINKEVATVPVTTVIIYLTNQLRINLG